MPIPLTHAKLATLVGAKFQIHVEGHVPLQVELVEAAASETESGSSAAARKEGSFSIVFWSEDEIVLPQRIYAVEHPALGRHDIFLVPIGPDRRGAGMRYEAVFN